MRRARPAWGAGSRAILLSLFLASSVFAGEKLKVYTVNYPLAYFAERIAGDLAVVNFPAPSGVDPAFWMPGTDTVSAYQSADLILLNGAGYAKWVEKVSLPSFRLVDTSHGFTDAHIQAEDSVNHSHGPGAEHSHGRTAFTTWLDLGQAAHQAEAIAEALARKRPDAKDQIDGNLRALKGDLLALHKELAEMTTPVSDRPLVASHPVYQYLARAYGLSIKSLVWEPDEVPSEAQWAELEGILKDHPAKWMLWERAPATESIERLRRLGVESIVFDPCGNRPEAGDFFTQMMENAENLIRAFQ